ncbi:MAG TPA: LysR substrate-binding domain-containing protein [Candidatus Methylacidiphilales bacterium]|jgi:DNA-binding transcriptional LysR family regulator|nr:LysR substrate-binding domain-containing protein [Candidatus Methylacidiphilales bacterium]
MELRHLRYFVVVAEEQNVTRAAERLHVSQPPLSRQIRDLEEELGVGLFRRTAKSLALTEAGKIFLNEARAVLLRVEQAVQTARAVAEGERGRLRVGYAPSLTVELLPRALRSFEGKCPGVRVILYDLTTEECVQRLAARKLDVALTVRPSGRSMRGLVFEKLVGYPLCCAVGAAHPLAKKRSVALAQLRQERFVVYSQEDYPEYFDWFSGLFNPHLLNPRRLEEYDSATGLIAAVEAGRGIAIVSASIKCLTGPRVKLLPLKPALPSLVVGALAMRAASPLAQRFIAAVKQVV